MTEKRSVDQSAGADSTSTDHPSRSLSTTSEPCDTAAIVGSQLRILRLLAEAVAAALREEMNATTAP